MGIKNRLRQIRLMFRRMTLRNHDFTIICNNCIGGCVYHDFHAEFLSPTINLYIPFPDFITFLKNIKEALEAPVENIGIDSNGTPRGRIKILGGGITLVFLHYKDFEEANDAWERRKSRINWNNLFIVLVERDGCTLNDLREFNSLPFEHKIAFTYRKYDDIDNSFVIRNCSEQHQLGNIMQWSGKLGTKFYDQFNWIRFLNQKS